MKKKIGYLKLFLTMMQISAFTFGGGFVIIGMMQKKFCDELHLISEDEVLDMTAIAQSSPGALAVNSAIIFGYRLAGIPGALISTLGTVIPPLVIISLVSFIYDQIADNEIVIVVMRFIRVGVAAVICDVVIDLASKVLETKDIILVVSMILAFVATFFFDVSAITLVCIFIVFGILRYFMARRAQA